MALDTIDTGRIVTESDAPDDGPIETLDVRQLGPPKPLSETLERLAEMDGGVLVQVNDRAPQHLYPKLDDRGYVYETTETDEATVTVVWPDTEVTVHEIDVRDLPPKERHPTIMDAFEELEPGESLTLVNDHDPKPLFYEMQAEREAFDADGYEVNQEGPDRFVATFPKESP